MKKALIMAVLLTGAFTASAPAFSAKEEDNIKVMGEEGAFGGLNYGYASVNNSQLYNFDASTNTKFFMGGMILSGGYKTKDLKAELLAGFAGYNVSYDKGTSSMTMTGGGLLLGIRLRYKLLPVIEYLFSTGQTELKETMYYHSLKIEMLPKRFVLDWEENEWFSKVVIYPGFGIGMDWVASGTYEEYDVDTEAWITKTNKDAITDFSFVLKTEIDVYPQVTFNGFIRVGLSGNIKGMLGLNYLFWGPWMENGNAKDTDNY